MSAHSLVLDSAGLPWRETPFEGVRWKKLFFDATSGRSAVLLSFSAGAAYGTHRQAAFPPGEGWGGDHLRPTPTPALDPHSPT